MTLTARRNLTLALLGLLFLGSFFWVVATQGPMASVKVTAIQPQTMTLQRSLFGIATIEARRSYAIGPTVAGRVASVLVDQGDVVKAGQLLAEMEPVDLESRYAASSAASSAAARRVQSAEAGLQEASSRARLAQNSAERFADLRRKNFVSQEAADAKNHEAAAAMAARQAAAAGLAAAQDELRRSRSDLAGIGKNRDHLRLVSPVNGVVTARLAEPGSTVVAGQSVVQVIDPASLWLRVRIDQGRSAGLADNLPARIVLRSHPGEVFTGKIARVDWVGDAVTEERIVNVAFDSPPPGIALGELAEVTLQLPAIDQALAIPAAALKRDGQTTGAWRLAEGKAQFAAVTTGVLSSDGQVQILDGLTANDQVIVHSSKTLTPGLRVSVTETLVAGQPGVARP